MNEKDFLWVEKYRPHKIADCILPQEYKDMFQEIINSKQIPTLLLTGSPGTGKTTVAKALCEETDTEWLYINASLERGIDVLRTKIQSYASSVSFSGGRKMIIVDEADGSTADFQDALRGAIEAFSSNCGFIFTANFANKLIPALHSRCSVIEFKIRNNEKVKLASQLFRRIKFILDTEKVQYDEKVVAEIIQKYFPDFRRTLNELQRYGKKIDVGILPNMVDASIKDLLKYLKEKDFKNMRKWAGQNSDQDISKIYRKLYDSAYDYLAPESIPPAIITIAEYMYRQGFVSDPEINLVACLTTMMAELTFK